MSEPGLVEVARVQGIVHEHSLLVPAYVVGPAGRARCVFVFDTGAFETLLYQPTARAAGLPQGQPLEVGGVGGASAAYRSTCSIGLGGVVIEDVACVVDDSSPDPLLGYRTWEDKGYNVYVDTVAGLLVIYARPGATSWNVT